MPPKKKTYHREVKVATGNLTKVTVSELRPGDEFVDEKGNVMYTVTGYPEKSKRMGIGVEVQWADGGRSFRYWDGPGMTIHVHRAKVSAGRR